MHIIESMQKWRDLLHEFNWWRVMLVQAGVLWVYLLSCAMCSQSLFQWWDMLLKCERDSILLMSIWLQWRHLLVGG